MSTATITPAAVAAATVAESVPSADALAAAIAAVSMAKSADDKASETLGYIVLERYKLRMTRHLVTRDGVTVLPENKRSEVSALIWLDATGNVKPVPAKDRTPGERSLGQYLSRYGTVAADMVLGVQALADTDTANATYKAINEANAEAKAREAAAAEALADIAAGEAFTAWLDLQPQSLKTAFKHVTHALRGDAAPHIGAFVATVTPVSK